nr:zinc finger protein OZF-like [Nerophis lumbriciformis]
MSEERDIRIPQPATRRDTKAPVRNLATSLPARSITNSEGDDLPDLTSLSSSVDIREAYCPEWQQSNHIKKEEEELCIKEEDQEKFTQVWHPHVEDLSRPPRIRKVEEELLYIKEEQEDITSLTSVLLKCENGGPFKLSGAEEPPSSILTEGDKDHGGETSADDVTAPISDSDHETSHSSDYDDDEGSDGQKNINGDTHWKCTQCGKTYRYRYELKMHMSKHTGHKPFRCSDCGKRFSQKGHLNRHASIHTAQKPFSCSICGQSFSDKGTLKYHTRAHNGEKPYSCSVCGQKFARNSHLKSHTRIHTGEKPFSCSICGQGFTERVTLKRHGRTHTGEKPFSCSICGQNFSGRPTLDRHTRTHTGEKPFSCSVCGQRFPWRDAATKHNCVGAKSSDQ